MRKKEVKTGGNVTNSDFQLSSLFHMNDCDLSQFLSAIRAGYEKKEVKTEGNVTLFDLQLSSLFHTIDCDLSQILVKTC